MSSWKHHTTSLYLFKVLDLPFGLLNYISTFLEIDKEELENDLRFIIRREMIFTYPHIYINNYLEIPSSNEVSYIASNFNGIKYTLRKKQNSIIKSTTTTIFSSSSSQLQQTFTILEKRVKDKSYLQPKKKNKKKRVKTKSRFVDKNMDMISDNHLTPKCQVCHETYINYCTCDDDHQRIRVDFCDCWCRACDYYGHWHWHIKWNGINYDMVNNQPRLPEYLNKIFKQRYNNTLKYWTKEAFMFPII